MKKSIYIYLYFSLTISLNGQVINNQELDKGTSIQRNTLFNLDEIKVRWKKAALDNCPGVPCTSTVCTAGTPSSSATVNVNTSLTAISISTTGATGIGTPMGLPTGVTATWSANVITISGTPTVAGNFNYTIPLTGGCGSVNATGTITVSSCTPNTAGTPSSSPTLTVNTALTNITITTTGATGIGTATGLPAGVTAVWASNVITISGTPTASGTFTYTFPLTGGCGSVNATGSITVISCPNNTFVNPTPSVNDNTCGFSPISSITISTTGATGIGTPTGLPSGVTATWSANVITISGRITTSVGIPGTFNYSIPLTGGCGSVNATGSIAKICM